ncbi:MAG: hypothetical protein ACFFEM_11520, partial [Candidatus Thorarchaeota archaeon]
MTGRSKKRKEEEEAPPVRVSESITVPPERPLGTEPGAVSMGRLVASTDEVRIDTATTADLARRALIKPQTASEIVPGHVLKRDELGRVHIK